MVIENRLRRRVGMVKRPRGVGFEEEVRGNKRHGTSQYAQAQRKGQPLTIDRRVLQPLHRTGTQRVGLRSGQVTVKHLEHQAAQGRPIERPIARGIACEDSLLAPWNAGGQLPSADLRGK